MASPGKLVNVVTHTSVFIVGLFGFENAAKVECVNRMRLCQKTLCQMALQGELVNVVTRTSVFVVGLFSIGNAVKVNLVTAP